MFSRNIVVLGRVQGVGFRVFVQRTALRFGVVGEVWNRRDSGVEMIAAHTDVAILDQFEEALKLGPGHVASVKSLEIEAAPFAEFCIGPTR